MRNELCWATLARGNSKIFSKLRHNIIKFLPIHSSPWALAGNHHGNCHIINGNTYRSVISLPSIKYQLDRFRDYIYLWKSGMVKVLLHRSAEAFSQPLICRIYPVISPIAAAVSGWFWLQKQQKGRTVSKQQKTCINFCSQIIRWE